MPGTTLRRRAGAFDAWPGFVDALATLVMVIVFVLMIFTLFQFYLKDVISGREQALERLSRQVSELADMLALERRTTAELRLTVSQLSAELQSSTSTRDRLVQELAAANARAEAAAQQAAKVQAELEDAFKVVSADKEKIEVQLRELDALRRNVETLTILRRELEAKLAEQARETERSRQALSEERKLTEDAQARVDLLTRQLNALQEQLAALNAALEASEQKTKEQQVQIADLGRRLNLALASKVEELARYRSEFFGRLRQVLGERQDIRIVGDRFVFQSEVLFPTGSAELEPEGREQIARLADTLKEIAAKIPADLNWVLQVEGHTDRRPIATPQFPSNWELSTARAIEVVKFLMTQGIPADRLAAAGFGEFQPIDPRDDEIGWRRNRRIEFKLTNR
ncbi:MAG TPA: peptidoglycan -binding protein [Alphaproteobacteria bacterium]